MIAIIGGTSLIPSSLFAEWKEEIMSTSWGKTVFKTNGSCVFMQRHGNPPMPPHRINHRANIEALRSIGADRLISINSVGSLSQEIKPGTFIIPHDFISLQDVPTFFDNEMRFTIPSMDRDLAEFLHKKCIDTGMEVHPEGVYIQTRGPRLETKAEIRFFSRLGDVIGMTMASEAALCVELGIPYASLCSVDNYCNGIAEQQLTMDEIQLNVFNNLKLIERLIKNLISGETE